MKKIPRVAINGFGRIGRMVLRNMLDRGSAEVVAINDLYGARVLAHLLKYDYTYVILPGDVCALDMALVINGKTIPVYCAKNPASLPWSELNVDIVIEATGVFLDVEGASRHLAAGAKKVVLSAPAKHPNVPTVVLGVNDHILETNPVIISNASCTTNCLAPLVKLLDDHFGLEKGTMNTIHAYTTDQSLQDTPHKDLRRARAACLSIIPTSTGAAKAIDLVLPHLKGKLDGIAMRVPVASGSIVDLTALLKTETTKEDINQMMQHASEHTLKGILLYTQEPIVSVDITKTPYSTYSSIVDANLTYAHGNLVRVCSWYDNENGYANRLVDLVQLI